MRNTAVLRDLFLVELQLLNTLIGNWVCACGCLCAPWEVHCPACRDEQPNYQPPSEEIQCDPSS